MVLKKTKKNHYNQSWMTIGPEQFRSVSIINIIIIHVPCGCFSIYVVVNCKIHVCEIVHLHC